MFINTKGSYLGLQDVNEDNVEDIIMTNGLNGKISKDNVYYLNGANLEKQDVYVCETMRKTRTNIFATDTTQSEIIGLMLTNIFSIKK